MASISVPLGELQALREEAKMAHKWAKEVHGRVVCVFALRTFARIRDAV